ncbi:MAG: hypothetical protein PGN08_06070 [Sphingomonas taxi]
MTPPLAGARAARFAAMLAPVAREVPGLSIDQTLLTERAAALGIRAIRARPPPIAAAACCAPPMAGWR